MASSLPRRMVWILLLAALAQPGWAMAHQFVHAHLEHHHSARFAPAHDAQAPQLVHDEKAPHDHGHLGEALLRAGRSTDATHFAALPSALPSPVAAAERPGSPVREGAPPRATPGLADSSQPRAPPHA